MEASTNNANIQKGQQKHSGQLQAYPLNSRAL